jgi:hypothetical protein
VPALTEHVLECGRHGTFPVQKQALDDLQRLSIALLFSTAEQLHIGVVAPCTERVEVLVHSQGPEVRRRHVHTRRALDHPHWSAASFALCTHHELWRPPTERGSERLHGWGSNIGHGAPTSKATTLSNWQSAT